MNNEMDINQAIKSVCNDSFPRNIVAICDKLGIQVQETQEFQNDISGIIYKEENKYFILVNANHNIGRKAFTIAHELGHYFLHRDKLENNSEIISYNKSKDVDCPALARCASMQNSDYNKMEREANNFAAETLMPECEFISKCESSSSIDEVARYFGVSIPAASVRANNLGGWFFL